MKAQWIVWYLLCFFSSLSGVTDDGSVTTSSLDPKAAYQYLEQNESELEKWAAVKATKGTEAFAKKEAAMQAVADRIIDYDFIARFVLGDKWESTSKEKRDLFYEKMKALFREFYLEEVFYNKSYEKRYIDKGIRKRYLKEVPESVFITTEVQATLKKKPVVYEVVYHLHQPSPGRPYLIFDIELDGVSMIRNYRQQFAKTLKDKTIDDLIQKIDERLKKAKKGAKEPATPSSKPAGASKK